MAKGGRLFGTMIVLLVLLESGCAKHRVPTCTSWKCADGAVSLDEQRPDALAGRYVPPAGAEPVRFAAKALPDGFSEPKGRAEATFEVGDRRVVVELNAPEAALVRWDGVVLDGFGALDEKEEAALASLAQSPIAPALAAVPLVLGCRDEVPAAHVAALLFPWQLILKYRERSPDERTEAVRALASRPPCHYFTDQAEPGPLRLENAAPFPNVFGYFAFDLAGAADLSAEGDAKP